jgi:hypothetical protein
MKRAMKAAAFAQGNVSIKREQSRTCSGFVERKKHLTKLNVYLVSSIPLVIQFKVMACDTQIVIR